MALHGIDVSSWQQGIDLAAVPCDFVIVKATQGTSYVSDDCARAIAQALEAGKLVGVYHYVSGGGARAEAEFFFDQCRGWNGRVVWCVDWEQGQNDAWGDLSYLDALIRRLASLTGRPPLIYASSSVFPWSVARDNDCGAWVAQYANNERTGYQEEPWSDGSWSGAAIHQYSSTGRLPGYGGDLDLNIFYGDASAWHAYAGGSSSAAAPAPAADGPAALTCHGIWDRGTTMALQRRLGTPVDGVVSSQPVSNRRVVLAADESWEWVPDDQAEGSQVIAELQRELGVEPDGLAGPVTAQGLCERHGVPWDGELSHPSLAVSRMQAALNEGGL